MSKLLSMIAVLVLSATLNAQTAPDAAQLTTLLNNFLAGAGRNDINIHENFWADDLIYTGAAGRRVSKSDIMTDLRKAPPATTGPKTVYSAEEIRIQQYGDTAIVAFRLVATVERDKKVEVSKYFNTGTFLKRNGKWQAVAWQATKLPRPEETAKTEVAQVEAEFHRALLSGNVATLESLIDESFVWTDINGKQITRLELIGLLKGAQLKFSKLETSDVNVAVSGDTAVVRGFSLRQRSAIPGRSDMGDPAAEKFSYTLTLVNKGGPWKVVALHSSRT
ncbi:MAG TPA: nuclear transport factor 2 family protein [Pyrinomonadaceae bacterium]|nr:nuclear transport factor 2 family protein [Pyrinomonadaceae bacterium]